MTGELLRIHIEMMAHIQTANEFYGNGICHITPEQIADWAKVIKEETK